MSALLVVTAGCQNDTPEYKLPDKIEQPKPGKVDYVQPDELVSLAQRKNLRLYYLADSQQDTTILPPLPGLQSVMIGDFFMQTDTMSKKEPLYLICLYGDDSRKAALRLANGGFDCFTLDGGMVRLKQYILGGMGKNK